MTAFSLSKAAADKVACDVLAIGVFAPGTTGPGAAEVERALGTTLAGIIEQAPLMSKAFTGKLGEVVAIPTLGKLPAKQILVVGLGDKAGAKVETARKAGATVARRVGGARTVATTIASGIRGGADAAAGAFAEGFLLASYKFERYKNSQNGKPNRVESLAFVGKHDARKSRAAWERAQVYADATNLARDLVNTPSGDKSPESLAAEARRIAKNGLKVNVLDEKQLAAKGFGGILGVGRGSPKPPRLVHLKYDPPGARKTIAIVGKGITFDSGGINLKPSEGLDWMKMDMGGGAAVLGAMYAISKLKPKVRVHGYIASAENMPDGDATRPGDVLKHYGGKTTEVGNTDAEGRLVMADAIVYAKEQGADVILDVATLTGACMVALGHWMFGVMGEPRAEARKVLDAAERAGEPAWELPLFQPYREVLDSEIADLRNIANKNIGGGAITAGLFLKEFADGTPYVHLDIAGPAKSDSDRFEVTKGATGAGVRTLVEYVLAQ
jgi:leucyl aminopeptidase